MQLKRKVISFFLGAKMPNPPRTVIYSLCILHHLKNQIGNLLKPISLENLLSPSNTFPISQLEAYEQCTEQCYFQH